MHCIFFVMSVELNHQITAHIDGYTSCFCFLFLLPAFASCFAPMGILAMGASPPILPSLTWMGTPILFILFLWNHMQPGAEEMIKCSWNIYEIGFGSGSLLWVLPIWLQGDLHWPQSSLREVGYLQKSLAVNDHLTFESFLDASGEDMGEVNVDSVGNVICMLVLCSVHDRLRTLQEAYHIVRPANWFSLQYTIESLCMGMKAIV